jgi:glycosyltransferase involved in cell wall biosynthesis
MKILLVTTSYPDENVGEAAAGNFVVDFARSLIECGSPTTVVAPAASDRQAIEGGADVRRFRVPRLPLSLLNPSRPSEWPWIVQTLTAGRRAVNQAAAETRPDHILALWVLPSGWWAMRAAARQNVPFSTWALGSDIWTLGRIPLISNMLSLVLRRAHTRFADGLQLGRDVEALSGRPCGFLPSSRNLGSLSGKVLRQQPPYRLAYLGRWHPNKGTDLLMEALQLLSDDDWARIDSVRICGGGPLDSLVRTESARLAMSHRPVSVGGYLDTEGARSLFAWADYVLIPSRIESIPVVFSDALQMNCPVIAMPVGDLQALIDKNQCGVCSHAVDPPSFASALRKAIHTSPRCFENGVTTARSTFDPRQAAAALIDQIGNSVADDLRQQ